jgi:hypothetical protein
MKASLAYTASILILSGIFGLFSSCSSLITDKQILYKQSIKGNKKISTEDLEALYRQKVNRKFYKFMPYASVYESSRIRRERQRLRDSLALADYMQAIQKDTNNQARLLKELNKKRKKIAYIDYRLEKKEAYYDTLLMKYYREGNEKKYYKTKRKKDKKIAALELEKEKGGFRMRVIGEPFSLFDTNNVEKTRKEMEKYLEAKGYFAGQVSVKIDSTQIKIGKASVKTVNVTYIINEGIPHTIDSIYYVTNNLIIDSLVRNTPSKLKIGQNLERSRAEEERNRIETLLLQNGFYRFDKQYIIIQVDTSINKSENIFTGTRTDTDERIQIKNLAHIRFVINNPQRKDTTFISQNTIGNAVSQIYLDNILGEHIQYKIKDVHFIVKEEGSFNPRDTLQYKDYSIGRKAPIHFALQNYNYSKKILYNKILIRPNELYQKWQFDKTSQNLSGLNLFKFRSIQTQDDKRGNLNIMVVANPYEKYNIVNEVGATISQNVPGPFFNTSLRIRNIFGGCGILDNSFLFSVDGQASFIDLGDVYRTTQISFTSTYIAPLLLIPGRYKYSSRVNALNPSTRITAGLSFVSRPEYGRRNFRLALTYNWHRSPFDNFGFTLSDVNVINTYRQDERFRALLQQFREQGNNLELSFRNALITSSHFYFEHNGIDQRTNTKQFYWRPNIEFGGNLFNFLQSDSSKLFGLQYFKFWRFSNELRFYQPLTSNPLKKTKMAYRLFFGVAAPYGDTEILPYEKFFFTGGNTMRGWIQRRLGPGGYAPPAELVNIEKPGNLVIEANTEFRFKVWSFINMGIFVDAGNVWTFNDNGFADGKFTEKFYEQIAVGTGAGLRLDFSFLLLRADLGLRVLDPARPKGERFVLDEVRLRNLFGGANSAVLNIGIGYPF